MTATAVERILSGHQPAALTALQYHRPVTSSSALGSHSTVFDTPAHPLRARSLDSQPAPISAPLTCSGSSTLDPGFNDSADARRWYVGMTM